MKTLIRSLLFKKRKGYILGVAVWTVFILAMLAVGLNIAGLTPTDLMTMILQGVQKVITNVTSKF